MARLVALEWDEREARVAVASSRRGEVVVEQAFNVALHPERPSQTPADIGAKIGSALNARGVSGRVECLVTIGRSSIELRNMSLPPAPADELPDLVRFQAMKEFNALGDDWPLDFLPISGSASEPHNVLAAAVAPDLIEQITATCAAAGLTPGRIVLRPCAAASLLNRAKPARAGEVRLLVDVLAEEADLSILVDDRIIFLRTARLHGEASSPEQVRGLIAEIRRTMVASQNRLGGARVESIFLCGDGPAADGLVAQLRQDLSLPVEMFQPFANVPCSPALRENLPAFSRRFSPLLGVVLDEGLSAPHGLDFLHPRKKPAPPSHRRQYLIAGAVAATILLAIGGGVWWSLRNLDENIVAKQNKIKALEPAIKKADELNKRMKAIDGWTAGDVIWLDELRRLSRSFPPSQDAILANLQMHGGKSGGAMQLDGFVRANSLVNTLETSLRDAKHRVETGGSDQASHSAANKMYQWHFKSKVTVEK